ncbi:hypothetical protein YTPLAS18_33980 [Nitrospira sp.]|nr:hypothetical protein YTPLAS18_33890 [Nitrospira sp.]GKS59871.1 hypothetical protein YTPLAS18_33980 [Nitrospira sp.]
MQTVFLSYASQDQQKVDQLAHDLSNQGVSYWRDREKLYAGQRWPRELGEAVAERDCVLLIWSAQAAESYYVELEWCTGLALKKAILPCRLDDTPLPAILKSLHSADLRQPATAIPNVLRFLRNATVPRNNERESEVIKELGEIASSDPREVVEAARSRFLQREWIINVFEGPVTVIQNPVIITPAQRSSRDPNLLTLMAGVKRDWIEGFRKNSLHGVVQLELGKQTYDRAIDHPLKEMMELANESIQPLPPGTRLIDVFNSAGGFLLILGEPGSGKTITLLDLTMELITSAESDPTKPIPVVLNLSTWNESATSLTSWTIGELKSKYYVGRRLSEAWLKKGRLLLLLDGLDEVRANARDKCVAAINSFLGEYTPSGVVVACRSSEYEALPLRLKFKAAIKLLPLTTDQVDNFLKTVGLETLQAAVKTDTALRELAQSPLMLNILVLAFKDEQSSELVTGVDITRHELYTKIMNRYIDKMFKRKGEGKHPYTRETVMHSLSWLAQHLVERSQTVFLIESLQPDWLRGRIAWATYWAGSRVAWAVAYVLILGSASLSILGTGRVREAASIYSLVGIPLLCGLGIITGLIDGKLSDRRHNRGNDSKWKRFILRILQYDMGYVLIIPLCGIPAFAFSAGDMVWLSLAYSLVYLGPIASFLSIRRETVGEIRTAAFGWSWKRAEKGYIWTLFVLAITYFLIGPLVFVYAGDVPGSFPTGLAGSCGALAVLGGPYLWRRVQQKKNGLGDSFLSNIGMGTWVSASIRFTLCGYLVGLVMLVGVLLSGGGHTLLPNLDLSKIDMRAIAILIGLIVVAPIALFVAVAWMGLAAASFSGFKPSAIESTATPNQGIKSTLRRALLTTIVVSLISSLMFLVPLLFISWTASDKEKSLHIIPLLEWLFLVVTVGLWQSTPALRHYVLRAILYCQGHLPPHFVSFLDYAAGLIFLQKVGGGYVFIHRLVMEHFASLGGGAGAPQVQATSIAELATQRATS